MEKEALRGWLEMQADRAVMPSRRVAGQALGLAGCGPEAGVGQRGTAATSRTWGPSLGFQLLYHVQ